MRKIITVSREFGSGGRELGKRLSDILGIEYVDGEIASELAKLTNLDGDYIGKQLENGICGFQPVYARSFSRVSQSSGTAMLLASQHKVIKEIAAKKDCIIVGRGADAVLAGLNPFKIFVYADMPSKIMRCRSRCADGENPSDRELERKIKEIDKARKTTHGVYSTRVWGDKEGYGLCINTTEVVIGEIAPLVAEYARTFFKNN